MEINKINNYKNECIIYLINPLVDIVTDYLLPNKIYGKITHVYYYGNNEFMEIDHNNIGKEIDNYYLKHKKYNMNYIPPEHNLINRLSSVHANDNKIYIYCNDNQGYYENYGEYVLVFCADKKVFLHKINLDNVNNLIGYIKNIYVSYKHNKIFIIGVKHDVSDYHKRCIWAFCTYNLYFEADNYFVESSNIEIDSDKNEKNCTKMNYGHHTIKAKLLLSENEDTIYALYYMGRCNIACGCFIVVAIDIETNKIINKSTINTICTEMTIYKNKFYAISENCNFLYVYELVNNQINEHKIELYIDKIITEDNNKYIYDKEIFVQNDEIYICMLYYDTYIFDLTGKYLRKLNLSPKFKYDKDLYIKDMFFNNNEAYIMTQTGIYVIQ